jgi:hypothetical protein
MTEKQFGGGKRRVVTRSVENFIAEMGGSPVVVNFRLRESTASSPVRPFPVICGCFPAWAFGTRSKNERLYL